MNKALWLITITVIASALALGLSATSCSLNYQSPSPSQPASQIVLDVAGKQYEFSIDQHGKLVSKVTASSADGRLSLSLDKGTTVLDKESKPLHNLQAAVEPSPPQPPENSRIIGPAYSFGPEGATFNPWLTLTMNYNPDELPPEIKEKDLYPACYGGTGWELPRYRRVDTEANAVTTQIYHFSTCTILGSTEPAIPSTTPPPATGTRVGYLAPDFELQTLDGQTFSLSGLRGKPVVLNFWTTWCGPCRMEMPFLQEIYEEYSGKGVVLAAIDIRESSSKVKEFMQNYGLSLPVLLDSKGTVAARYGIAAIPTTYFIDKDGIIRDKKIGAFRDKAEVERSLNKIIPGKEE